MDIFLFNNWEIIGVSLLLLLLGIQLYFYLGYYRKPYAKAMKRADHELDMTEGSHNRNWKVSVIISSENEVVRLSKNLPIILEQDYPNFEVIVINNGSTDETDDLIESLKLRYKNIHSTYVPYSNDRDFGRKKLAFTLGAKAAQGDILMFVEPHSKPISKDWIKLMVSGINDKTEVVLGASYFTNEHTFINRIARFDNHMFNMQFLSKALEHKPFTGIYRNIAFKKELFFDNKGFASHLSLENGEDLFVNQIVNASNTDVCLHPDSFTEAAIDNYSLWKRIKKNYSVARSNFKDNTAHFFAAETISRFLFYALVIAGIAYAFISKNWGILIIVLVTFIIRYIAQLVVISKGSQYFKSGKFFLSIIPLDLLQLIYNLLFRTRNKRFKLRK